MSFSIAGNTFTYEQLLTKVTYPVGNGTPMWFDFPSAIVNIVNVLAGVTERGVVEIISAKGVKFSREMRVTPWIEIPNLEYKCEIL